MIFTMPRSIVSFWNAAKTVLSNPRRYSILMVPSRHAGVTVNAETAMTVSGYWRAINYISGQIAGLPRYIIQEIDGKTKKLSTHPAAGVMHRPSAEVGPFTWAETMFAWALSWGNGYSEIERNAAGSPIAMHLISPDRVEVDRGFVVNGYFEPDAGGQIFYRINNQSKEPTILPARDVFHLHGLGFDGLVGYSVVSMAARSLGISIAAERFEEDFFANGLVASGYLQHPNSLKGPAYDRLKEVMESKALFGQKWKPLVLEEGMEWKGMTMPVKDAEMLETRKLQISDLARWFGLPPHKLADLDHATFSNIESQSREVVNDCFMPWIHRLEEEADYKLIRDREKGVRAKVNVRGLLRGDDASRAAYYQIMTGIGAYSVNDVLRLEDMDPIGPEGDERLVQLNLTTLKRLVTEGSPQSNTRQRDEDITAASRQGFVALMQDAFGRILRRELNRFEQNRHKFTNSDTFFAWFDEFQVQQREYIADTLRPIMASMTAMLALPPGSLFGKIKAIADIHVETTQDQLAEIYTSGGEYDVNFRARKEALETVDLLISSIIQGKIQ